MKIEQYEQATELLEAINSVKGYIAQFQSTVELTEKPIFETASEELEFEKDRQLIAEAVANLNKELHRLQAEFEAL